MMAVFEACYKQFSQYMLFRGTNLGVLRSGRLVAFETDSFQHITTGNHLRYHN